MNVPYMKHLKLLNEIGDSVGIEQMREKELT